MGAVVEWGWGEEGLAAGARGAGSENQTWGWGWRPRHKNPGAKLSTCAIVPSDLTDKIKLKGKIVKNFKTATANHQTLSARPF